MKVKHFLSAIALAGVMASPAYGFSQYEVECTGHAQSVEGSRYQYTVVGQAVRGTVGPRFLVPDSLRLSVDFRGKNDRHYRTILRNAKLEMRGQTTSDLMREPAMRFAAPVSAYGLYFDYYDRSSSAAFNHWVGPRPANFVSTSAQACVYYPM